VKQAPMSSHLFQQLNVIYILQFKKFVKIAVVFIFSFWGTLFSLPFQCCPL